jgi:hypothetical protein
VVKYAKAYKEAETNITKVQNKLKDLGKEKGLDTSEID